MVSLQGKWCRFILHTSGISVWVSCKAAYYDNANLPTASVDVGTNGGTAGSSTVLVTQYQYNAAGCAQDVIDPRNIDTRSLYHNLGRVTQTIPDDTGAAEGHENDVSTHDGYDGNTHVTSVQANEPGGGVRQTLYLHGVTAIDGHPLFHLAP